MLYLLLTIAVLNANICTNNFVPIAIDDLTIVIPNIKKICKIINYAKNSKKSPIPTLKDYQSLGIKNMTLTNIIRINKAITLSYLDEINSITKIQIIVNALQRIPPCNNWTIHDSIIYCTIISPYTGKVWLDKNLGAKRRCISKDDRQCYGDYYQWGRNNDGHQKATSSYTDIIATDINAIGHSKYITQNIWDSPNYFDWTTTDIYGIQRTANWSKIDGSSICPIGFRVPTHEEIKQELFNLGSAKVKNSEDSYRSFLKIPISYFRDYVEPANISNFYVAELWTSSSQDTESSHCVFDTQSNTKCQYHYNRIVGMPVRCIKN